MSIFRILQLKAYYLLRIYLLYFYKCCMQYVVWAERNKVYLQETYEFQVVCYGYRHMDIPVLSFLIKLCNISLS